MSDSASNLLAMTTTRDGETLHLTLTGSAETEVFDMLAEALDRVHGDATRHTTTRVIADLRGLEFASSSSLKAFISWLQRVQSLDEAKRYRVIFRANREHSWQERSLRAIKAFASDIVEIDVGPV